MRDCIVYGYDLAQDFYNQGYHPLECMSLALGSIEEDKIHILMEECGASEQDVLEAIGE